MLTLDEQATEPLQWTSSWAQFLAFIKKRCSATAFENWLAPIRVVAETSEQVTLEIPNIFVKEYLLDNYKSDLAAFLPMTPEGEPALLFVVADQKVRRTPVVAAPAPQTASTEPLEKECRLNALYKFETFIEGPSNQFVKSAAMGIAHRPARSYNPLFIHGGVGLGKTHLLHAIGHHVREHHKKLKVHCITTEGFINDLVDHLRNKSIDKMKRFYRSLDFFLVDDIQFLQNRLNFEEEFCNTFESLINQNKQIVITSDKPPGQLKLSERIVARMEWGLVAHVGVPDLETRVAILQHKAEQRGLKIPQPIAFYIAEHVYSNVRQLEGAINRLIAQCRLFEQELTEEFVEQTLRELFQHAPKQKASVESILKSVATVLQVRISDLKGALRTKEVASARQVAMYLAKELVGESLVMLAASFGKSHSTLLHACKTVEERMDQDEKFKRQVAQCRRAIESA